MSFKNEDLIAVCQRTMPFGKYQGRPLIDRGFPRGELGRLMALAMILSVENLKHLVTPFRE